MKIAIAGKGGVGKTTLAGLLARAYAAEGRPVLAIDADPDANLASALGIPAARYAALQPFSRMKDLAKQRTGASSGYGGMFILNPKVDDLPEAYWVQHAGVRLLLMGTVEQGGTGCVCPEHTLLRRLMAHLLLERQEVVIMDMEAGIEHLGRGTAQAVDVLIVVVEPGQRSIQTARHIATLAADIGIQQIAYVGSKITQVSDQQFLASRLDPERILGYLSFDDSLRAADLGGNSAYDIGGDFMAELALIKQRLASYCVEEC